MTHPDIDNWCPVAVEETDAVTAGFPDWFLCGGRSVDFLVGRTTRTHGDTDIGVFRSALLDCLRQIQQQRVFLCKPLRPWDGRPIPPEVHDIWVTSDRGNCWALQILVYDDEGDEVVYRRDPRVRWPKAHHTVTVDGLRILNPVITLLFKCHGRELQHKDASDLRILIEAAAKFGATKR